MLNIELESNEPIYEQLYKKVVKLSSLRVMIPNQALPSVRGLAKDLGINPNTVQKAYQMLERDNIIYSIAGKGSFISSDISVIRVRQEMIKKKIKKIFQEAVDFGIERETILKILDKIIEGGIESD